MGCTGSINWKTCAKVDGWHGMQWQCVVEQSPMNWKKGGMWGLKGQLGIVGETRPQQRGGSPHKEMQLACMAR